MKVLLLNSVCGIRSTGKIVTEIAEEYIKKGYECRIAFGREVVPQHYEDISYKIGTEMSVKLNALKARVFDNDGFNATYETRKFLQWADDYNPDILWIHNLHGYYINVELLFEWIKSRPRMNVKWTLHDCWAFTGHCAHFSFVKCNRWETSCGNCCQIGQYPKSLFRDASHINFLRKKNCFTNVPNLSLIVPSQWLANLVKRSFLNEYPIEVVYNSINTMFKPTSSNIRQEYNLVNKKVVLGVASVWSDRKGLYDFIELSKLLDDKYKIVLIGIDSKSVKKIPSNVICLPRTDSLRSLAEWYSAADIFVNPSKEETFGLTTVEALSCGTPAIVYKNTACEEVAYLNSGIVVEQSPGAIMEAIKRECE